MRSFIAFVDIFNVDSTTFVFVTIFLETYWMKSKYWRELVHEPRLLILATDTSRKTLIMNSNKSESDVAVLNIFSYHILSGCCTSENKNTVAAVTLLIIQPMNYT